MDRLTQNIKVHKNPNAGYLKAVSQAAELISTQGIQLLVEDTYHLLCMKLVPEDLVHSLSSENKDWRLGKQTEKVNSFFSGYSSLNGVNNIIYLYKIIINIK